MASLTPEQTQALEALDVATARFRETEAAHEISREEVHRRLVAALSTGIGPTQTTRHSPYQRNHVEKIRDAAGIPKRR